MVSLLHACLHNVRVPYSRQHRGASFRRACARVFDFSLRTKRVAATQRAATD